MAAQPNKPTFELSFIDETNLLLFSSSLSVLLTPTWLNIGSKCNFFLKSKHEKGLVVLYTLNQ